MTYEEAKAIRSKTESMMEPYETALRALPKGKMGLTIPEHKDEFRALNSNFQYWFKQYQNINKFIAKNFKKEVRAEYAAKRESKLTEA